MVDAIPGEHLRHIFKTASWWDHTATFCENFGFSLSIYSLTGKPVHASSRTASLCRGFCSSSLEFKSRCETHCLSFVMNTISTGKPDIFKCYSRIMCFVFPIRYLDEKAVVLGKGSFSSYEDFRECMNLAQDAGLDAISVTAPLSFTSHEQTRKIYSFVTESVTGFLQNTQETVTLRKKFEGLKKIIGMWGADANDLPEALFEGVIRKLSTLLDIDYISVLVHDKKRGKYTSLYSLSKSGGTPEAISISEHDAVVRDLINGKPFILSAEPIKDPRADFLNGMGALYFFPIMVGKKLEGLLRLDDRGLREGDRQVISAFCRQAALALENRHLQQELYNKFDQFAAISELTKTITPIQDYETLLRTVLDLSAGLLKAEQGSLMMIDQETDALLLEAKKGMIDGVAEKHRINRGDGIAGKVAESGVAILVENLENDPRIKQKNRQHYKTPSFVSVPLKINDRIIGVLNLSDKTTGEVFDEEDLKLIQSFATHAAIVMERNVFFTRAEELKKLTITDSLTGLLNRRYLYERLKDELGRSRRHGHSFSLLMLDLDGFKQCNDTLGHPAGDRTLKTIADILLNVMRSIDIVARCGGDEFMVILPETDEPLAIDIAERLRSKIEKMRGAGGEAAAPAHCALTTSIGLVSYPRHGDTGELLLQNVDKALYRAKNKGKNRVEVYS